MLLISRIFSHYPISIILYMKNTISPNSLLLSDLEGRWYIQLTNFPMWLKGDKTNPTIHYSRMAINGIICLYDVVTYEKKGVVKSIIGCDHPLSSENISFEWQGMGKLSLLKSKWDVIYLSPGKDWSVIHFEKTWFTPSGYDVISKKFSLSDAQREAFQKVLKILQIDALLKWLR